MPRGDQLYVRGMKAECDDLWDDSQLIKAYEKAKKEYRAAELAQRIAMSTNTKNEEKATKPRWRANAPCRAPYEGDGEEYEAYIVELLGKEKCVVRFVGYGDEAIVKLRDLKQSHGNAARTEQVYNITNEPSWKEIEKSDFGVEESALDSESSEEGSENAAGKSKERQTQDLVEPVHIGFETPDLAFDADVPVASDRHSEPSSHKKNNKKKKKSSHKRKTSVGGHEPTFDPTRMPIGFDPCASYMNDISGTCNPLPLPPLLPLGGLDEEEHEVLNNMLTAWYMSGYYAGLYQSRLKKRSKKANTA